MSSSEAASDGVLLAQHTCPVCYHMAAKAGALNPRHTLLQHLKRKQDEHHKLWRELNYRRHFPVGSKKQTGERINIVQLTQLVQRVLNRKVEIQFIEP